MMNLSGLIICFLLGNFSSVGAFFERPRANTVRPYHVLVKDFAISPLILHSVVLALFYLQYLFHPDVERVLLVFGLAADFKSVFFVEILCGILRMKLKAGNSSLSERIAHRAEKL